MAIDCTIMLINFIKGLAVPECALTGYLVLKQVLKISRYARGMSNVESEHVFLHHPI